MDRGFFKLFPNLYVALVGPTAITKTTAADIGVNILDTVAPHEVLRGKSTSWYLLDWLGKRSAAKQSCVCTLYSGEMKHLLGDLNKAELVTLLTDAYTCPDKTNFNTKTKGKIPINEVCFNILACSTPEWLTTGTTLDEIHGGFTGRFVYVYADVEKCNSPFPEDFFDAKIRALRDDLIDDLRIISTVHGNFIITDQAKADYTIWYKDRKAECTDERLAGYFGRKRDLVLKVSMLLSVAKDNSLVIDESTLKLAWKLLSKNEEQMGNAFSGVVDDPALKYKDTIVVQLARSPNQEMFKSTLLKANWHKFDSVILDRIITNLVDAKMVETHTKQTSQGVDVLYKLVRQ